MNKSLEKKIIDISNSLGLNCINEYEIIKVIKNYK